VAARKIVKVPILDLKPTQFAVGFVEIDEKVKELKKLRANARRKKIAKKLAKKPVPIVVSPWGESCIIDGHHFVLECWHLGVKKLRCEIVHDFSASHLTYPMFWRRLSKLGYAHLYDQFGDGLRSAFYLPNDVRGLADDPYRSLAWLVRKEGGYAKSDAKFAEFEWTALEAPVTTARGRVSFVSFSVVVFLSESVRGFSAGSGRP